MDDFAELHPGRRLVLSYPVDGHRGPSGRRADLSVGPSKQNVVSGGDIKASNMHRFGHRDSRVHSPPDSKPLPFKPTAPTLPKYQIIVLDAPRGRRVVAHCAAMIVPRGMEQDWVYSSEGGQWQLLGSAEVARLILVARISPSHDLGAESTAIVKQQNFKRAPGQLPPVQHGAQQELQPLVLALAPRICFESRLDVPFVTYTDNVVQRFILEETSSRLTGAMVVEDVELCLWDEEEGEGGGGGGKGSSRESPAGDSSERYVTDGDVGGRLMEGEVGACDVELEIKDSGSPPIGCNLPVPAEPQPPDTGALNPADMCSGRPFSSRGSGLRDGLSLQANMEGLDSASHLEAPLDARQGGELGGKLAADKPSLKPRPGFREDYEKTVFRRRLRFQRMPNLIQSEVPLVFGDEPQSIDGRPPLDRPRSDGRDAWDRDLRPRSSSRPKPDQSDEAPGMAGPHQGPPAGAAGVPRPPDRLPGGGTSPTPVPGPQPEAPPAAPAAAVDLEATRGRPDYRQLVHKYLSPIVAGLPLIQGALESAVEEGRRPRALVLGGGACTLPIFLRRNFPFRVTVAELDEAVVGLARRHFGLLEDDNLRVHIGDGRLFLTRLAQAILAKGLVRPDVGDKWRTSIGRGACGEYSASSEETTSSSRASGSNGSATSGSSGEKDGSSDLRSGISRDGSSGSASLDGSAMSDSESELSGESGSSEASLGNADAPLCGSLDDGPLRELTAGTRMVGPGRRRERKRDRGYEAEVEIGERNRMRGRPNLHVQLLGDALALCQGDAGARNSDAAACREGGDVSARQGDDDGGASDGRDGAAAASADMGAGSADAAACLARDDAQTRDDGDAGASNGHAEGATYERDDVGAVPSGSYGLPVCSGLGDRPTSTPRSAAPLLATIDTPQCGATRRADNLRLWSEAGNEDSNGACVNAVQGQGTSKCLKVRVRDPGHDGTKRREGGFVDDSELSDEEVGDPRLHFLVVDVDVSDGRLGLSSPPPAFLEDEFLLAATMALHSTGLLAINVVPYSVEMYQTAVDRLKRLFGEVYESNVDGDINRVLYAIPSASSQRPPRCSNGLLAHDDFNHLFQKIHRLS